MVARVRPVPDGWQTTPDRIVLEHGRAYTVTAKTFKGKRGRQGACYMNAGRIAMDTELTYVEGYVSLDGFPIQHAWLADADGNVIDPTLKPTAGTEFAYFGVPFSRDFLRETALRTQYWGVLSLEHNRQLFETGYTPDA